MQLKVSGNRIIVCDKWGNGLDTSASKLNRVIGEEPKTLTQICDDSGVHLMARVYPHMKSLRDKKHVTQLEDGRYVAANPAEPAKDSIIAEQIIQAITEHLGSKLDAEFTAGEIRKRTTVLSGSFSPVLKGMRDDPGTAPDVRADLRGVVTMTAHSVYRLTERGKLVVQQLQSKTETTATIPKKFGAGFGSPENNAKVEAAAIKAVSRPRHSSICNDA